MLNLGNRVLLKLLGADVTDKDTKKYLLQMDPLTLISLQMVLESCNKINANPKKGTDIKTCETDLAWKKFGYGFSDWKRVHVRKYKHQVTDDFSIQILGEDDNFGKYTCTESVIGKGTRSTKLFPMKDPIVYFDSKEHAEKFMKEVELAQGMGNPLSYNEKEFDMVSDESFSRIFFFGIGAPLLRANPDPALGPFVVDMPLQDLEVRKGFIRYGARVHFNDSQQVTAIFDYVKNKVFTPKDSGKGWEEAKFLAKVTSFTLVTARGE